MSKVRNQSSYTYNHEQAQAITPDVIERFAPMIAPLRQTAAPRSKEQFSNSADLNKMLLDAIIGALDAHQLM